MDEQTTSLTGPKSTNNSNSNGQQHHQPQQWNEDRKQPTASAKSSKAPSSVIHQTPFIDTLAVLIVFLQCPSIFMVGIHVLFIIISNNSTSLISSMLQIWNQQKSVIIRTLIIDLVIAFTTLYVTPAMKDLTMIFAHAIVASSLSGGQKVFTNAVYSTSLIEVLLVIWRKVYHLLFNDEVLYFDELVMHDSTLSSSYSTIGDISTTAKGSNDAMTTVIGAISSSTALALENTAAFPTNNKTFNTVASAYTFVPNAVRFLSRINWVYDCPLICFQLIAVHVISLGLLPYIRKVFPERTTSSISSSNSQQDDHNFDSSYIDEYPNDPDYNSSVTTISVRRGSGDINQFEEEGERPLDILYPPSSSKKNKRLIAVRASQPLWSTLASSIVLAARQAEQQQEQDNLDKKTNQVTGATDVDLKDADISEEDDNKDSVLVAGLGLCYLKYVFEHIIGFQLIGFDSKLFKDSSSTVIIRVNGIVWPQVAIQEGSELVDDDYNNNKDEQKNDSTETDSFLIIIYGLTAITQYEIEIAVDGAIYSKIDACTLASSNSSNTTISSTPTRPLSPVTTLLDSLTTTQMTLSEEKSRLKRLKRDNAKRLANLRNEIDSLKVKLETSDKGEERNRRKVLSLRESVRQYEEEIETVSVETVKVEKELQQLDEKYGLYEEDYLQRHREYESNNQDIDKVRQDIDTKIVALEAELASFVSKRDKLFAKRDRLAGDLEKLENDCKVEVDNEFERRKEEREKRIARRLQVQEEFSNSINVMEKGMKETQKTTQSIFDSMKQREQPQEVPHINSNLSISMKK